MLVTDVASHRLLPSVMDYVYALIRALLISTLIFGLARCVACEVLRFTAHLVNSFFFPHSFSQGLSMLNTQLTAQTFYATLKLSTGCNEKYGRCALLC